MARGLSRAPSRGGLARRAAAGFPALRHRNFRRYILGQGVSLVGFWMQNVAQGWLVYRLSGSALALGAVACAAYVPVLCLAPVAGVIADHVRRHRLILVTQTLAMLLAFVLGTLVVTDTVTVPLVAAAAACLGVVGAFDLPTRQAFLVEMVGAEDLPGAIALNASTFNAARVIGPAIAGILVGTVGEGPCFFLNGASYLAVLWALWGMQLPAEGRGAPVAPRGAFRSGLAYVRGDRVLSALLLALGIVSGLSLQVNVLMPVVARRVFDAGAMGYGLLLTAFGTGAVLSALWLASRRYTHAGHRRNLLLGLAVFGGGLLGLAASPRLEVALACQACAGLGMIRYTATTNALLQLSVDDRYRGRVMGLHTVMFTGTAPLGSLLLGALAQRRTPIAALVVAGATPLVVAAWLATRLPGREGPADPPVRLPC